jgi:hypothetical protein
LYCIEHSSEIRKQEITGRIPCLLVFLELCEVVSDKGKETWTIGNPGWLLGKEGGSSALPDAATAADLAVRSMVGGSTVINA